MPRCGVASGSLAGARGFGLLLGSTFALRCCTRGPWAITHLLLRLLRLLRLRGNKFLCPEGCPERCPCVSRSWEPQECWITPEPVCPRLLQCVTAKCPGCRAGGHCCLSPVCSQGILFPCSAVNTPTLQTGLYLKLFSIWEHFIVPQPCLNGGAGDSRQIWITDESAVFILLILVIFTGPNQDLGAREWDNC